jgi:hypothetical protein
MSQQELPIIDRNPTFTPEGLKALFEIEPIDSEFDLVELNSRLEALSAVANESPAVQQFLKEHKLNRAPISKYYGFEHATRIIADVARFAVNAVSKDKIAYTEENLAPLARLFKNYGDSSRSNSKTDKRSTVAEFLGIVDFDFEKITFELYNDKTGENKHWNKYRNYIFCKFCDMLHIPKIALSPEKQSLIRQRIPYVIFPAQTGNSNAIQNYNWLDNLESVSSFDGLQTPISANTLCNAKAIEFLKTPDSDPSSPDSYNSTTLDYFLGVSPEVVDQFKREIFGSQLSEEIAKFATEIMFSKESNVATRKLFDLLGINYEANIKSVPDQIYELQLFVSGKTRGRSGEIEHIDPSVYQSRLSATLKEIVLNRGELSQAQKTEIIQNVLIWKYDTDRSESVTSVIVFLLHIILHNSGIEFEKDLFKALNDVKENRKNGGNIGVFGQIPSVVTDALPHLTELMSSKLVLAPVTVQRAIMHNDANEVMEQEEILPTTITQTSLNLSSQQISEFPQLERVAGLEVVYSHLYGIDTSLPVYSADLIKRNIVKQTERSSKQLAGMVFDNPESQIPDNLKDFLKYASTEVVISGEYGELFFSLKNYRKELTSGGEILPVIHFPENIYGKNTVLERHFGVDYTRSLTDQEVDFKKEDINNGHSFSFSIPDSSIKNIDDLKKPDNIALYNKAAKKAVDAFREKTGKKLEYKPVCKFIAGKGVIISLSPLRGFSIDEFNQIQSQNKNPLFSNKLKRSEHLEGKTSEEISKYNLKLGETENFSDLVVDYVSSGLERTRMPSLVLEHPLGKVKVEKHSALFDNLVQVSIVLPNNYKAESLFNLKSELVSMVVYDGESDDFHGDATDITTELARIYLKNKNDKNNDAPLSHAIKLETEFQQNCGFMIPKMDDQERKDYIQQGINTELSRLFFRSKNESAGMYNNEPIVRGLKQALVMEIAKFGNLERVTTEWLINHLKLKEKRQVFTLEMNKILQIMAGSSGSTSSIPVLDLSSIFDLFGVADKIKSYFAENQLVLTKYQKVSFAKGYDSELKGDNVNFAGDDKLDLDYIINKDNWADHFSIFEPVKSSQKTEKQADTSKYGLTVSSNSNEQVGGIAKV